MVNDTPLNKCVTYLLVGIGLVFVIMVVASMCRQKPARENLAGIVQPTIRPDESLNDFLQQNKEILTKAEIDPEVTLDWTTPSKEGVVLRMDMQQGFDSTYLNSQPRLLTDRVDNESAVNSALNVYKRNNDYVASSQYEDDKREVVNSISGESYWSIYGRRDNRHFSSNDRIADAVQTAIKQD